VLKNKIVYARSCISAKILGKESIKNGCNAYIGYDDEFVFSIEIDKITRPLEDKTAEVFLKPSNSIAISLLKGNTVSEANNRSKEMIKKQIRESMTSNAKSDQKELIPLLLWNYDHQVSLGDQNARL